MNCRITFYQYDQSRHLIATQIQPMRSWVKHFFDLLYCQLGYDSNSLSVNDILGVSRAVPVIQGYRPGLSLGSTPGGVQSSALCWNSASNYFQGDHGQRLAGDWHGIQLGTDNTAVSPTQDTLVARVVHGEGASQLLYGGTEVSGLSVADPNGEFKIRRYFTNESGGNITIQEVGLYTIDALGNQNGDFRTFMIARDVVNPAVVVGDTEILEVEYTVQITV